MINEEPGTGAIASSTPVDAVPSPPSAPKGYMALSRSLPYSLLFVLPLVLLYEVGIILTTGGTIRIGADIWIRSFLSLIGLGDTLLLSALLVAVTSVVLWRGRRQGLELRAGYFGMMLGESLLYAIVSGVVVSSFVAQVLRLTIPPLQTGGITGNLWRDLALSLGAGVYEELLFRLILVSALAWIFMALLGRTVKGEASTTSRTRRLPYLVAAVIGALIFSWVHYIGSLGDSFALDSFTFRFLMGLVLNGIFLWRGFGIAAMTHALFDVVVTLTRG